MRDGGGGGADDIDAIDFRALVRTRLESLDVDAARAAYIVDELAQHCAQHYADLVASGLAARHPLARAPAPPDNGHRVVAGMPRGCCAEALASRPSPW